jgi:putative lipase involved disintegration of autophagic bodies
VCGCYRGGWKCEQNCLEEALIDESVFFPVGTVCGNENVDALITHAGSRIFITI